MRLLLCVLALAGCAAPEVQLDFRAPASIESFDFSDPSAWRWNDSSLELFGASDYTPEHRSPQGIALLRDVVAGDFVLEAELMQTGREYGHRDMCLFFCFESPERYYYVHLAPAPDENAHNAFLVDRAPRRNLAPVAAAGIDWGDDLWHRVRLVRERSTGRIEVYFDDMHTPVLVAQDKTLPAGRIGFGSFDDTGRVRRVRIRGSDLRTLEGAANPFAASGKQ